MPCVCVWSLEHICRRDEPGTRPRPGKKSNRSEWANLSAFIMTRRPDRSAAAATPFAACLSNPQLGLARLMPIYRTRGTGREVEYQGLKEDTECEESEKIIRWQQMGAWKSDLTCLCFCRALRPSRRPAVVNIPAELLGGQPTTHYPLHPLPTANPLPPYLPPTVLTSLTSCYLRHEFSTRHPSPVLSVSPDGHDVNPPYTTTATN